VVLVEQALKNSESFHLLNLLARLVKCSQFFLVPLPELFLLAQVNCFCSFQQALFALFQGQFLRVQQALEHRVVHFHDQHP